MGAGLWWARLCGRIAVSGLSATGTARRAGRNLMPAPRAIYQCHPECLHVRLQDRVHPGRSLRHRTDRRRSRRSAIGLRWSRVYSHTHAAFRWNCRYGAPPPGAHISWNFRIEAPTPFGSMDRATSPRKVLGWPCSPGLPTRREGAFHVWEATQSAGMPLFSRALLPTAVPLPRSGEGHRKAFPLKPAASVYQASANASLSSGGAACATFSPAAISVSSFPPAAQAVAEMAREARSSCLRANRPAASAPNPDRLCATAPAGCQAARAMLGNCRRSNSPLCGAV